MSRTFKQTKLGDVIELPDGEQFRVASKRRHYIWLDKYMVFNPNTWRMHESLFDSLEFSYIKNEERKNDLNDHTLGRFRASAECEDPTKLPSCL